MSLPENRFYGVVSPEEQRIRARQQRYFAIVNWFSVTGVLWFLMLNLVFLLTFTFYKDLGFPLWTRWISLALSMVTLTIMLSFNLFKNKIAEHFTVDFTYDAFPSGGGDSLATDCDSYGDSSGDSGGCSGD